MLKRVNKSPASCRILGIDPGYERLGIAIIERTTTETLLYSECFKTATTHDFVIRLNAIGTHVEALIKKYAPHVLAIENLFMSTNQKTAMRVSEVRGMLLYIAQKNGLRIVEFTPLQIKMALTGYGKSDKRQVAFMVRKIVRGGAAITQDDEMDALAIALTGSASVR